MLEIHQNFYNSCLPKREASGSVSTLASRDVRTNQFLTHERKTVNNQKETGIKVRLRVIYFNQNYASVRPALLLLGLYPDLQPKLHIILMFHHICRHLLTVLCASQKFNLYYDVNTTKLIEA